MPARFSPSSWECEDWEAPVASCWAGDKPRSLKSAGRAMPHCRVNTESLGDTKQALACHSWVGSCPLPWRNRGLQLHAQLSRAFVTWTRPSAPSGDCSAQRSCRSPGRVYIGSSLHGRSLVSPANVEPWNCRQADRCDYDQPRGLLMSPSHGSSNGTAMQPGSSHSYLYRMLEPLRGIGTSALLFLKA